MIKYIEELAQRIDEKWTAANNCGHAFPDIVLSEMNSQKIVEAFDFTKINEWISLNQTRSVQIASEFSDLHIKLFDNGKFYIEILNWWDEDTAIHDHGFSGVLVQLCGSALNSIYQYQQTMPSSQNLTFGNVTLKNAYVSEKGDVHKIPPGRQEIHAVFHLEQPTCSLIIRTHPIAQFSPQLNYFPPYLCANHSATDLLFNKRIKFLRILDAMSKSQFEEHLVKIFKRASLTEVFWYLLKLNKQIFKPSRIGFARKLYDLFSPEQRPFFEMVVSSALCRASSQRLVDAVKTKVTDKTMRLYLAMAASCYSPEDWVTINHALKSDVELSDTFIDRIVHIADEADRPYVKQALNILKAKKNYNEIAV